MNGNRQGGRLNRLDIKQMRVLQALLRERNLSRVADEMGLTQQAISEQLRKLRALFDDRLFLRQGNTLANPLFLDKEALKTFDYVVANPPFSDKRWSTGLSPLEDDHERFKLGVPPGKNGDYAYLLHIISSLKSQGKGACVLPHGGLFRGNAEADIRNEKINYKVREHSLAKVPHLLVVGKREAEEGTVAIRTLGEQQQKVMSLDEAIAMLKDAATPPDLKQS